MAAASPPADDDFQKLADDLAAACEPSNADFIPQLAEAVEQRVEDLKKLLDAPTKNDTSRCKVKSGKLELVDDGREYQMNEQFIQQTIQLADDLNLDEVLAARLLYRGAGDMEKLDRSPSQGALFLYHLRRKNILDCIRLLLVYATDENTPQPVRLSLEKVTESMVSPTDGRTSLAEQCILAMAAVRQSVRQLREKEKHAETLRLEPPPGFKEDLNLQIQQLRTQHENLTCIISYLVKFKRTTVADFRVLMAAVRGLDTYDVFTAHHVLPLFAFATALCGTDSPLTWEETIQLHKELLEDYKERPWPLRYMHAALLVGWLSEFNGLCNDPPDMNAPSLSTLDYTEDIFNPSKAAMKDGAFEFLLAMSADVNSGESQMNASKEELHRFLQRRVPPLEDAAVLFSDFRSSIIAQLELFVENFISNMADVLKEMKTREEEDVLMGQRAFDYELERFFLMIHYVYVGRKEAGLTFWGDMESNLFGFLQWGSSRQTAFVEATFSYMLASLSFGEESATNTHRFLLDELTPGSTKNRRGGYLSWDHIFKQFQVYIGTLDSRERQQSPLVPANAYRAAPPSTDNEPSPEMSMILDSHMRLISQIATDSRVAREWLLRGSPRFRIIVALFDLLKLQASVQLWDSVFATINALLTDKAEGDNNEVWSALDKWALGPSGPTNAIQVSGTSPTSEKFSMITSTVYPAEAFVQLLTSLVSLPEEDKVLQDVLPFPETLGSSYRITGLDQYIDFVLGTIFANTNSKILPPTLAPVLDRQETTTERILRSQYKKFRPALQLSCLTFIHTCISTLNDDLFVMANKKLPVDVGMRSSSLETYAKLHPFGRVMEHLYTEKVLNVIFEILKLGVEALLGEVQPTSSVIRTVQLSIDILDLAMRTEPTYTQIIRPLIKQDEGVRRSTISSHGFSTLADAILYHLDIVVSLGLYVGAPPPAIVLGAIGLLEKLAVVPKLVTSSEYGFGSRLQKNRLLGRLEQSPESRRIVFNFINRWHAVLPGADSESQLQGRLPLLSLLESSLDAEPKDYTFAHMLLGFGWDAKDGVSLSVASGGIGTGTSLLHCILETAQNTPEFDGRKRQFNGALCRLKSACYSVLQRLWKSPATSSETLFVLRANRFLFSGFLDETIVTPETLWDGVSSESPEFFNAVEDAGAVAFCNYIRRRSSLFEYTALEIRHLTTQGASTMVSKYLSTLLGVTASPDGPLSNVHILDLLDFLELELPNQLPLRDIRFFQDTQLDMDTFEDDSAGIPLIDLRQVHELLLLRRNELLHGRVVGPELLEPMTLEISVILAHLQIENQRRMCERARLECLKSWSVLVVVMLEDCEWETATKTAFILQALQAILPKLEGYIGGDAGSAEELSSLAHALISHLSFDIATFGSGRASDVANDRLYHLFRVSLRCIQSPLSTTRLREDFYNIALRYLTGMTHVNAQRNTTNRHNTRTIKTSGDRLLEVVCNDAWAGDGDCKVVALLLLDALAAVAGAEGSSYVVDSLMRQNFLVVLIDSIKSISYDMQIAKREDVPLVKKTFKAATGFLLRIAQTRAGAGHVLNAGLFQALRECQLFSVDPDLGFGGDKPEDLRGYHELLLDVVRLVACCILSRGPQNRQTLEQGRRFLTENRTVMATIFKRHAKFGGGERINGESDVKELVDMFVLLTSLTGFIEAENAMTG